MLSLEAAPSGCPRTASARDFVGRGARGFWSPVNGGLDLDAAALEGAGESVARAIAKVIDPPRIEPELSIGKAMKAVRPE